MIRTTRRALCASAVLIGVLAAPAVARADVIGEWNATAQAEAVLIRPTAHGQARGMAMVQGAVYDAVNAIVRTHQPYLLDLDDVDVQPFVSQDAAVATAAHHVLVKIVAPERVAALDTAYQATLQGIPDGPMEQGGVEAGEAAAQAMLDARAGDGFMAAFTPTIGTRRRRLAADRLARDAGVRSRRLGRQPQAVRDQEPVAVPLGRPERPDERRVHQGLQRGEGARGAEQHEADRDQTTAAVFWQFPPAALYNQLARELAAPTRYGLDTFKQARLYAMVNLAMADGAISCWNDKYHWAFWRPRMAIREGETDGNAATDRRPALGVALPPVDGRRAGDAAFPDHPSGHGCVSGAVLRTFREFFGTDKVAFDIRSGRFPNQPRHFDRFSLAMKEVVDARVWGGIHFRTADVQGAVMGKKVAFWLQKHYFNPVKR